MSQSPRRRPGGFGDFDCFWYEVHMKIYYKSHISVVLSISWHDEKYYARDERKLHGSIFSLIISDKAIMLVIMR